MAPLETPTETFAEDPENTTIKGSNGEGKNSHETSAHSAPSHWQTIVRWLRGSFWAGLGYMLSPLSWWNDVFFNLPIAYAFGYCVSWLNHDWFLPGTVVGYWLSNVIGIVMMQVGITDVAWGDRPRNLRRDILWGIVGSTIYSIVIVLLAHWDMLSLPDFLPVV
ncbi:MAG: hypothetical protein AAGA67_09510 [Cyanobacteria bacterium P01_F01_bin.153]